jgi:hypothetical protein
MCAAGLRITPLTFCYSPADRMDALEHKWPQIAYCMMFGTEIIRGIKRSSCEDMTLSNKLISSKEQRYHSETYTRSIGQQISCILLDTGSSFPI